MKKKPLKHQICREIITHLRLSSKCPIIYASNLVTFAIEILRDSLDVVHCRRPTETIPAVALPSPPPSSVRTREQVTKNLERDLRSRFTRSFSHIPWAQPNSDRAEGCFLSLGLHDCIRASSLSATQHYSTCPSIVQRQNKCLSEALKMFVRVEERGRERGKE